MRQSEQSVEVKCYMSDFSVDEISIGVAPSYSKLGKGYHYPALEIQARTAVGDETECRRICQKLSFQAAEYFCFTGQT